MDKRTGSLDQSSTATPEALSNEVAVVRQDLDVLLAELDQRRHDALDVRLQVRRHSMGLAVAGVALFSLAGGAVWLNGWRQERRDRASAQAGRLRQAVSRMIDEPDRVAAEPTIAGKIAAAAGSAAAAFVVRKLLERAVQWLADQRPATDVDTREIPAMVDEFQDAA